MHRQICGRWSARHGTTAASGNQRSGSVISGLEGARYGNRYCCVGRYGSGDDCAKELLWTSLRIKIGRALGTGNALRCLIDAFSLVQALGQPTQNNDDIYAELATTSFLVIGSSNLIL
jgi:hypothetical protein